jgi:hypothetical protein
MKKKIKKIGKANAISFTKEEMENEGWKLGDVLDLSDIVRCKIKSRRTIKY